jgi:hypothetical protein
MKLLPKAPILNQNQITETWGATNLLIFVVILFGVSIIVDRLTSGGNLAGLVLGTVFGASAVLYRGYLFRKENNALYWEYYNDWPRYRAEIAQFTREEIAECMLSDEISDHDKDAAKRTIK